MQRNHLLPLYLQYKGSNFFCIALDCNFHVLTSSRLLVQPLGFGPALGCYPAGGAESTPAATSAPMARVSMKRIKADCFSLGTMDIASITRTAAANC